MGSKHLHETRIPQSKMVTEKLQLPQPNYCYTYAANLTFDILQKHFIQTSQLNVFLPSVSLESGLCYTWLIGKSQVCNKNKLKINFYKLEMSP